MDIILYNIIAILLAFIFGYFFGSIPTGVILCRLFYGKDPRDFGSKNSGGTNVGRVFGMKMGAATIILDAFKTVFPMVFVYLILNFAGLKQVFINNFGENFFHSGLTMLIIAPLGATIGHCWPIYAHFKGGKAVSSFAGFAIATSWMTFGLSLIAFLITLKKSKHVSLSSIVGSSVAAISSWIIFVLGICIPNLNVNLCFWGFGKDISWVVSSLEFAIVSTLIFVMLVVRHKSNIKRLASHTESKIKWMK